MAQVKNLKIGNTSYGITDANTLPALTAAQRTTLLSNGTYLGKEMDGGEVFENNTGKIEQLVKTPGTPTISLSQKTLSLNSPKFAYGNGMWVAVGNGGSGEKAAYSTDGVTWTKTTISESSSICYNVCFGNNVFVAVFGLNSIWYSTNGKTWTKVSGIMDKYCEGVTFGNGKFIVVGRYYSKVLYSTNGINWSTTNMPSSSEYHGVVWGDNKYVAVAYTNKKAAYSANGTSWTEVTIPTDQLVQWESVAYGNGKYVAVGHYEWNVAANVGAYSTDGITWTTMTMPASQQWKTITFANGYFVAAGVGVSPSPIAYSTDGINWSTVNSPIQINSSAYINGDYYLGGSSNYVKATFVVPYTYSMTPLSYTKAETDTALATKQGTLTAGANVTLLQDGTISATDTTYTAGDNIQISDSNVISATSSYITNTNAVLGSGAPTSAVDAELGQLYVDILTGDAYVCKSSTPTPQYTVVGSPTISNGIASGFSQNNYLQVSEGTLTAGKSLIVNFSVNSIGSSQYINMITGLDGLYIAYNGGLGVWNWGAGDGSDVASPGFIQSNTDYTIKIDYASDKKTYSYLNNGEYSLLKVVQDSGLTYGAALKLGGSVSEYLRGSIKLKNTCITNTSTGNVLWRAIANTTSWQKVNVNTYTLGLISTDCKVGNTNPTTATAGAIGQHYLNDTTKGLFFCDTTSPLTNWTSPGTPNVSPEGIFSCVDSAKIVVEGFKPGNKSWEITFCAKKDSHIGDWSDILFVADSNDDQSTILVLEDYNSTTSVMYGFHVSTNGSSWAFSVSPSDRPTIPFNQWTYYRVGWDTQKYYYDYSLNGVEWTRKVSYNSTTPFYHSSDDSTKVWFGRNDTWGVIDLKKCYIKIDGEIWWTPYAPTGYHWRSVPVINDDAISSVTQTWSANKIVTVFHSYASGKQDLLTELPGYDATATQSIKNINGVLQWVTDSTT